MTNYETRVERGEVEAEFDQLPTEDKDATGPAGTSAVISVRLRIDELNLVEIAARAAGLPLSTFIRRSAIGAASVIDIRSISAQAEAIQNQAHELVAMLRAGAA